MWLFIFLFAVVFGILGLAWKVLKFFVKVILFFILVGMLMVFLF